MQTRKIKFIRCQTRWTISIVSVRFQTCIQTSRGLSKTTMIIRSKTCMNHWNTSTIERHVMENNVLGYILSIIALIVFITLPMIICGSISTIIRSNVYCLILSYQTNRIQTRWSVPIHPKECYRVQIQPCWNIPVHLKECCCLLIQLDQLDAVSWRGKMRSAQILKSSCTIKDHIYNTSESKLVRWTTYGETMRAWAIAQQSLKPGCINNSTSYCFTILEVWYHEDTSTYNT